MRFNRNITILWEVTLVVFAGVSNTRVGMTRNGNVKIINIKLWNHFLFMVFE